MCSYFVIDFQCRVFLSPVWVSAWRLVLLFPCLFPSCQLLWLWDFSFVHREKKHIIWVFVMVEQYQNKSFSISVRQATKISKSIRRVAEPVRSSYDCFLPCALWKCNTKCFLERWDNSQDCVYLHRNKSHVAPP